jgi:hypothetical protein
MNHFISLNKLAALEAMKGAFLSSVQTENLTVAYTDMKAGVEIPLHHHTTGGSKHINSDEPFAPAGQ